MVQAGTGTLESNVKSGLPKLSHEVGSRGWERQESSVRTQGEAGGILGTAVASWEMASGQAGRAHGLGKGAER